MDILTKMLITELHVTLGPDFCCAGDISSLSPNANKYDVACQLFGINSCRAVCNALSPEDKKGFLPQNRGIK
jgi:hypothetical protein